jgi:hypothetical protein
LAVVWIPVSLEQGSALSWPWSGYEEVPYAGGGLDTRKCPNQAESLVLWLFHKSVPMTNFAGIPNFCHTASLKSDEVVLNSAQRALFRTGPADKNEDVCHKLGRAQSPKKESLFEFKKDSYFFP